MPLLTIDAFSAAPLMPNAPSTMFPSVPVLKAPLQRQRGGKPKLKPRRRIEAQPRHLTNIRSTQLLDRRIPEAPLSALATPLEPKLVPALLITSRTMYPAHRRPTTAGIVRSQRRTLPRDRVAAPRLDLHPGVVLPTLMRT